MNIIHLKSNSFRRLVAGLAIIPVNFALVCYNSSCLRGLEPDRYQLIPWLGSLILMLAGLSLWLILPAPKSQWCRRVSVIGGVLVLKYFVFFMPMAALFEAWAETYALSWAVTSVKAAVSLPVFIGVWLVMASSRKETMVLGALLCIGSAVAWYVHGSMLRQHVSYIVSITRGEAFALHSTNYLWNIILGAYLMIGYPVIGRKNLGG